MDRSSSLQLTQATRLEDIYKTVSPEPLLTHEELTAFYRDELNEVRGGDRVAYIALGLGRAWGGAFYKAFLMGHPGVGKSTEMTRLAEKIEDRFRTIRFQVTRDLDPGSFKPFDILFLMMVRVVESTALQVSDGGAGQAPPDELLQAISDWFLKEETIRSSGVATGIAGAAGVGPPASSLWHKVTGLFATLKGEIKYATDRSTKIVDYRLQRVSELIDLLNKLLVECNELLRKATGREWLFIGEEFDKPGIPAKLTEDLFLSYANVFKGLQGHLIFNIPIGLVYSEKATQLPFANDRIHIIPDTPVYDREHRPCKEGREALSDILDARVAPDLFAKDQKTRLIVASGGNLRDLFTLVGQSADNSMLNGKGKGKIHKADTDRAIVNLRTQYERSLGESPFDAAKVTYPEKAARLVKIYEQDQDAKVPDPVLYSLLNGRSVQEFNGDRWFGVHPLVVDILKAQGRLTASAGRTVPGGTE